MAPLTKLTPHQRREIVLSALDGESKVELAKRYSVARSWVYSLLDEALENPEGKEREAEMELKFRQSVTRRSEAKEE